MKQIFQNFLKHTVEILKSDERLCGLAVGGSWITDEMDEYSDLDLVIVATDERYVEIFNQRFEITKSLGDLISAFSGEHVGEPRLLICLYKNPLIHVDIKFVALKDFGKRIEDPAIVWEKNKKLTDVLTMSVPQTLRPDLQWIEDRFWTWTHYGAVKIARGEIFEAIGFLGFMREKVLGPMAMDYYGKNVRGVRRLEMYAPEFSKKLEKTIPIYDRLSCLRALHEVVGLYQELRQLMQGQPLTLRSDAEEEGLKYLLKIASRLQVNL